LHDWIVYGVTNARCGAVSGKGAVTEDLVLKVDHRQLWLVVVDAEREAWWLLHIVGHGIHLIVALFVLVVVVANKVT
jgi:hypothetical protein